MVISLGVHGKMHIIPLGMHVFVQKHFLIPLGYQIDYHVRALMKLGISPNDVVIAFSPSESNEEARSRSEKAFQELQELLGKLGIKDVRRVVVAVNDPITAISTIVDNVAGVVGQSQGEVIISFSGGIRALGVYMLMAYILLNKLLKINSRFYVVAENLDTVIELTELLNVLRIPDITETELSILSHLAKTGGCLSAADISEYVGKDTSTVNRQLGNLEEEGFVKVRRGRARCFEVTNAGKLLYLTMASRMGRQNLLNTQ